MPGATHRAEVWCVWGVGHPMCQSLVGAICATEHIMCARPVCEPWALGLGAADDALIHRHRDWWNRGGPGSNFGYHFTLMRPCPCRLGASGATRSALALAYGVHSRSHAPFPRLVARYSDACSILHLSCCCAYPRSHDSRSRCGGTAILLLLGCLTDSIR